mgnify:CR=1 FL=1
MAFDAIKKLAEGVPEYLEIPVEEGMLDRTTAVLRGLGYDMEEAISIFLRRIIQTPYEPDKLKAEEHISRIADTSLDDMVTQPLLVPKRDVFCVQLLDYAKPGFCTHWKPYFGTVEDIAEFRHALHQDEKHIPEDMTFSSVRVFGSEFEIRDAGMYEYTNIWGFPYFVWWDKLESIHLWVAEKDKFYRCIRARMTNLQYDTDENASMKQSPGEQIWGYPHILEYHHPFHFNRMYVIEKRFESEADLLNNLSNYKGNIELGGWLDELFADG